MPALVVEAKRRLSHPVEKVYETLRDLRSWPQWSPWLVADPDAEVEIDDDTTSVGSAYRWRGEIVGEGSMQHFSLDPPRRIDCDLDFVKPFRSHAEIHFELGSAGENATDVTWRMNGRLPAMLFWMKSQMQSLIRMDYERGLKRLDVFLECGRIPADLDIETRPITPDRVSIVGRSGHCRFGDIESDLGTVLEGVQSLVEQAGIPHSSMMGTAYTRVDMKRGTFDYFTGVVASENVDAGNELSKLVVGGHPSATLRLTGGYRFLDDAWNAVYQNVRGRGWKVGKWPGFEINRNDPATTSEHQLVTDVYVPLKRF